jgi:ribosome-associated toxin RatA of RatAB toxin-antitoxin module
MPTITSEITVHADVEKVYALAKDVEHFPDIMADVEKITVLEREGNRTVTEWVGKIRQFNRTVKWTEEDHWNDAERSCAFEQIKGDFSLYRGLWKFEPANGGTRMTLTLEYEYDVPLIGPLIKKVVQKLVKANCDQMLDALKREAERAS